MKFKILRREITAVFESAATKDSAALKSAVIKRFGRKAKAAHHEGGPYIIAQAHRHIVRCEDK
jgi:hypothetical protein